MEVAAGGRGLIVDPGRYTYAEAEPNLRRRFKATAAHNTVTVDGLDQTPYRRGKPKEPIAEGRFLGRTSLPGLDVLRAEVRSGCYDAVHTRTVAFVAGEYWLVEDRLHGESQHRYDLRFQLGSEAWRQCRLDTNRQILHAPGFALVVVGADTLALEESWIAPEYGIKQRAPAVSATVDGCNAVFTTLIAPIDACEPVPHLRVRRPNPDETDVVVEGDATRDHISWNGATADWQREEFA